MSRYYFHLTHSTEVRDEMGEDLGSLQEAKCRAVKIMSQDLCDTPQKFWDGEVYRVTVTDAQGLQLFSVELHAALAPVLWPPKKSTA